MSLTESAFELVRSVIEMPGHFVDVAAHDPLSAVLVAVGAVLTAIPVLVFGYLALGAAVSVLNVETVGEPPREAQ